ncbi:anti-sigma B factor antagonist [Nonomuraea solani]|uniref:Anti-sigma factor antagonist n=1 Tax=Nonomuraea solani TaxID=1144553 RepID=A0A1H6D5N9_9ACTN|nr:anti-sigma B factor antagonist [Nonomuraea solani]
MAVHGALDLNTSPHLEHELAKVCRQQNPPLVIMDLSGVEFCDSSGLSSLVRVWRQIDHDGGALVLIGLHGTCERLLRRTGLLERIFPAHPTLAQAQDALTRAQR